ncbi:MAG: putative oxidoreductase [Bradyrhizobium sp.]|jgi:uncharacterized membrane protein YphA (DoxX/SURF4 family)|nr:putative oxidoreductase [Bradyrhizobium sp.]
MPAFITFGRVLLSMFFIFSGVHKLLNLPETVNDMTGRVVAPALLDPYISPLMDSYAEQLKTITSMSPPETLVIAAGIFQIVCGAMIALNFGARFFAILLIFFVVIGTFYFEDFWNPASPPKTIFDAFKSLAIIGGLFLIAGIGRRPKTGDTTYSDV